jgi:hypothetical protein
MLIMAEVTSEMGAELRAAALANHTSVAGEVGRRLERLARLEAEDSNGSARFDPVVRIQQAENEARVADSMNRLRERSESLYSGPPSPFDMFRSTGRGR